MSRLVAFGKEYWKQVGWVEKAPDNVKKLGSLMVALLPLLGFTLKDAEWLRPWSPYLFIPLILYLVWKAGAAWDRTRGPTVLIGDVQADKHYSMFDLHVWNAGGDRVWARVFASDIAGADGSRLPVARPEIELHWRNEKPGASCRLFGHKAGSVGVFVVEDGKLALCAQGKDGDPEGTYRKVPLPDQQEMTLTIRVDFSNRRDRPSISNIKRFHVRPDAHAPLGYSVRTVKMLTGWLRRRKPKAKAEGTP